MSHDLRTPLASIKASVTSLLQRDIDWTEEATLDFLATIDEEADRLDVLVANLLDMSRLQSGGLRFQLRPVGYEEVVPAALASLSGPTDCVDITLDETLPRVVADPALLERAIANIMANAVAMTRPGGRVRIEAGAVAGRVDLRIVDQGPGIAPEDRARIFEPFQRLGDAAGQRGRAGPGRGPRVRGGHGRRAHGRRHARGRHHDGARPARGGRAVTRVLVVDDEPQIVRALATNLRARGFEVDLAATGEDGLRLAADHHPDVVILDLGLPGIDGLEVVGGLRGWTNVPIIVLSVREGEADKVAALDAGADDYLTKPFGMNELLARIRAAVRRNAPVDEEPVVRTDAFTIDLVSKQVQREGEEVRLTPTEWHLVEVLVRHAGRLVSQRQLLQEVWGPQYGTESDYLRVYMAQVRRKLEPDPPGPATSSPSRAWATASSPEASPRLATVSGMPLTSGINHVAFLTTDMDRTIRFYEEAFEAKVVFEMKRDRGPPLDEDRGRRRRLDAQRLPGRGGRVFGERRRPGKRGGVDHFGFQADSKATLEELQERLAKAGAEEVGEVQRLGGEWSLFFRDIDGLELEVCAND